MCASVCVHVHKETPDMWRTINWGKTGASTAQAHTRRGMDQLPAVSIKDAITVFYILHTPEISQVTKKIQDNQHISTNTLSKHTNKHTLRKRCSYGWGLYHTHHSYQIHLFFIAFFRHLSKL